MFTEKQKVWCVVFGAGVVRNILASGTRFPLVVEFNGKLEYYTLDGKLECYTLDGKCALNAAQALFPHPVEVIKKVTKPSINWDNVHSKFNYLAQDADGSAWLYTEKPQINQSSYWSVVLSSPARADSHVSYDPGTCDWRDSLVKRPN